MNTDLSNPAKGGINAFTLKLIAIFGMTLDHIGIVFGEQLSLFPKIMLYALGGLTFPIMAYLLIEGYKHTSNFKRYALRLLLFAVLAQLPYMWAMQTISLNVLFTLLLGLLTIYLHDHMKNRSAFKFLFLILCLVSAIMDWSLLGVPMVLLYHIVKGKWQRLIIPILPTIALMLLQTALMFFIPEVSAEDTLPSLAFAVIGCSLTVPLLAKYNGHRGPSLKYLFYLYYPAHLVVLAVLRGLSLLKFTIGFI